MAIRWTFLSPPLIDDTSPVAVLLCNHLSYICPGNNELCPHRPACLLLFEIMTSLGKHRIGIHKVGGGGGKESKRLGARAMWWCGCVCVCVCVYVRGQPCLLCPSQCCIGRPRVTSQVNASSAARRSASFADRWSPPQPPPHPPTHHPPPLLLSRR